MGNPNHETDELLRIHHAVPALQTVSYTHLDVYKRQERIHKNEAVMMEGFSEAEQCLLRRFLEQILVNIEKIQPEEAIEKLQPEMCIRDRSA